MKTLRGSELKRYFADSQTVSRWWKPEEGDYHFFYRQELRILEERLPVQPHWKVLDAATGDARYARWFARNNCQVVAVDINPEMISRGKQKAFQEGVLSKIDFRIGDLENLKLEENSFDVVSCMDAIDHIENLNQIIERLASHLKPNGYFLITFVSSTSFYGILHRIYRLLARQFSANFIDLSRSYRLKEIKRVCRLFKIKIISHDGIGLICTPQTRVSLPFFIKKLLLWLAKTEVGIKPYYHSRWLTPYCSTLVVVGQKLGELGKSCP